MIDIGPKFSATSPLLVTFKFVLFLFFFIFLFFYFFFFIFFFVMGKELTGELSCLVTGLVLRGWKKRIFTFWLLVYAFRLRARQSTLTLHINKQYSMA